MGELRSTFKSESGESGRLKVNMGKSDETASAPESSESERLRINMGRSSGQEAEAATEGSYVGRKFLQRDSGQKWEVFEENRITRGPLEGETMLRLKSPDGVTVNKVKSHMDEILSEENGAWQ